MCCSLPVSESSLTSGYTSPKDGPSFMNSAVESIGQMGPAFWTQASQSEGTLGGNKDQCKVLCLSLKKINNSSTVYVKKTGSCTWPLSNGHV